MERLAIIPRTGRVGFTGMERIKLLLGAYLWMQLPENETDPPRGCVSFVRPKWAGDVDGEKRPWRD